MKIIVLVVILAAGMVVPLYSQVDKPRAEPTERLPAPAKLTATQDPGGSIRVVWSAVEGAERYSLTRSAPPAGAEPVNLPNPADTVYIDRNVEPGGTYYYLVGAVNEAGIMGLRVSGTPVTFRAPVPPQPTAVRAELNGTNVTLSWRWEGTDLQRFMIERGEVTENKPPAWIRLVDRDCCLMGDNLDGRPAGMRVLYRVKAVSKWGDVSQPAVSNELTTPTVARNDTTTGKTPAGDSTASPTTRVLPAAVAPPGKVKVGGPPLRLGSVSTFTDLRLQRPRWVSLDEAIATVTADGRVRGRSPGFTYVVVTGITPDGAVASMVTRMDVAAR